MTRTLQRAFDTARAQPWLTFAIVCTALIGLGPRLPLDIAVPGRIVDLRLTDLVILAALPGWLATHLRRAIRLPVVRPIFIYLLVSTGATAVGWATLGLNGPRALFYLAKEVEYFVLFLMIASSIRGRKQIESVLTGVLVVAAINLIWLTWQLAVQRDITLLSTDAWIPADVLTAQGGTESYGPHLVGELSPFSIGALFSAAVLLVGAMVAMYSGSTIRTVASAIGAMCVAAVVVSQSRIWLASALIATIAVIWFDQHRAKTARRVGFVLLTGAILSVPGMYRHASEELPAPLPTTSPRPSATPSPAGSPASSSPSVAVSSSPTAQASDAVPQGPPVVGVARRLSFDAVRDSIETRVRIWQPLVEMGLQRALVGYGKGAIGVIPGLGAGEAHDYYLRTFVETGIVGLVSFIAILVAVLRISWKGVRTAGGSGAARWWCLAFGFAMIICGFVQDAFTPVIVAELFWLSAGLAVAEARSHES